MDGPLASKAPVATAIQSTPPPAAAPVLLSVALPPAPPPPELVQACPRQAQWALAGLLGLTAVLLLVNALRFHAFGARPTQLHSGEPALYTLDLNQASAAELMQLPGVGPKLAQAIIDRRQTYGPFRSVADLDRVHGIGPAALKRLEGWVHVEGVPQLHAPFAQVKDGPAGMPVGNAKNAGTRPASGKAAALSGKKVNVNTASAADLQLLPRIGVVLAQRILDERGKQPFRSIDDLTRVKGIGPKTLDELRPFVAFN